MALSFEIAGAQIDGARDYQEDAFLISHLGENVSLVIVADGMGGHAAGNVASNMAVQAFNKYVTTNFPSEFISEVLNGAILKANHSIAETIKETPALDGMGCTMVAALLQGNNIWWASVGDSHLYLLRNRELNKLNADHSYGGFLDAMAKAGTPVEAEPGLARNMLMSAITGGEVADIDCPSSPLQLKAGDKILLCSDGIDTLSDGKIIQYSEWAESPKECADGLLNAVDEAEAPKQDNTTVIVINIIDKEAKAAAAAAATAAKEDDDEDEDITDTRGAKKASLDTTTELSAEIPAAPEAAPTPALAPESVPAPSISVSAESEVAYKTPAESSKTGMIIGIAAAVLIAIGVGGYFMLGKSDAPAPDVEEESVEAVAEEEAPVAEEVAPEETEISEPEAPADEEVVEETPVEPEATPAVTEKPPVEAAPAPAPVASGAFTDALKSGGKGPEMVWIPAGSLEMGSPSTSTNADERPEHTVKIKKFAMSKFEVTFSQYDKFARATGRKLPDNLYMDRDTSPVIFVSWDDAYNYAKWLADETGKKYRLASEAEWEYAASGGNNAPFWWGYDEETAKAHCFTCDSQFDPRKPAKIGSFDPNPFGLYDIAGNVAEWTHDCWHENYKDAPGDGSVWEGGDCTQRVVRGGSFISPQQSIRTAKRDKFKSNSGYDHVGIRVVREE